MDACFDSPLSPWERVGVRAYLRNEVIRGKGCAVFHATVLYSTQPNPTSYRNAYAPSSPYPSARCWSLSFT